MCSILSVIDLRDRADLSVLRPSAIALSALQRHRGPDWSGVYEHPNALLVHERLSIVDPAGGAQPVRSADGNLALAVNGEIYNHAGFRTAHQSGYAFQTGSDCEVINALYARDADSEPSGWLRGLNGMFAFVLWDAARKRALIARDHMGICPLYWGHDVDGRLWVASEMKALARLCGDVSQFPPGHVFDTETGVLSAWYAPKWRTHADVRGRQVSPEVIRETLEAAVHRQLMGDVPYGVLLSGGLDSSIIAACAARFARRRVDDGDNSEAWWPRVHSFAIGLEGSPDLAAAEVAARAIDSVHHGFTFGVQEGLDALPDVIRHIESFDVTTVRASTPMFLLARRIKSMGVKMVLSGEGSDELFGGYLYFHKAPDAQSFHEELVRKLDALHQFDCLRANKSMMAWGVEPRVPFLDPVFMDVVMGMDAEHKRVRGGRIEKHILREAFRDVLPEEILWRQKEQFSDGVGYGWIDGLKAHAEVAVSDAQLASAAIRFPLNTPASKEAYLYRVLFERTFPSAACAATVPGGKSIACSSPAALAWDASFAASADPSGRAMLNVHHSALSH